MARRLAKDKMTFDILSLIVDEKNQSQIARCLKVTPQRINKRVSTLKAHGYLSVEVKEAVAILTLTKKGVELLAELARDHYHTPNPPSQLLSIRKRHILGLKYHLRKQLKRTQPARLFQQALEVRETKLTELKNNTQATEISFKVDLTIKLTTKSLILYAPELFSGRGELSIEKEAEAKKILDKRAQRFAEEHKLSLEEESRGVLYSEVLQEEIAHERHPLAKATPEDVSKIVLARSPLDGKERLVVDSSKGRGRNKRKLKELEAVHRKSAGEDSDKVDQQFNAVLDGDVDLLDIPEIKELIVKVVKIQERTAQVQAKTQNQINQLSEELNIHSPYLKSWKIVADAINSPIKRARARKKIEELGQRELGGWM